MSTAFILYMSLNTLHYNIYPLHVATGRQLYVRDAALPSVQHLTTEALTRNVGLMMSNKIFITCSRDSSVGRAEDCSG